LRSKKDVSSSKRLASLLECPPFTFISDEVKIDKKKIVSLDGDIIKPELGLSSTDRQLVIDNVSVVFHCAASVRFNAPLK
jgi:fatty acyl-CoA reductase